MDILTDLKNWRAERPDEWKMDEFIRNVQLLKDEIDMLKFWYENAKSKWVGFADECDKLHADILELKDIIQNLEIDNYALNQELEEAKSMEKKS